MAASAYGALGHGRTGDPSSTRGDAREDAMTNETNDEIDRLIGAMTLDEKASLTAGATCGTSRPSSAWASRPSRCPTARRASGATASSGGAPCRCPAARPSDRRGTPSSSASSATCWPPRPAPRTCTCCWARLSASCARRSPGGPSSPSPRIRSSPHASPAPTWRACRAVGSPAVSSTSPATTRSTSG